MSVTADLSLQASSALPSSDGGPSPLRPISFSDPEITVDRRADGADQPRDGQAGACCGIAHSHQDAVTFVERFAGDMLPYARHIDDVTLAARDGQQMQIIHLAGFAFETSDTQELNYRKNVRDTVLRGIASSRLTVGLARCFSHSLSALTKELVAVAQAMFGSDADHTEMAKLCERLVGAQLGKS